MVGGLNGDTLLDHVTFNTKADANRFDATISSRGMTEKIASGMLDQLVFHLPSLNHKTSRGSTEDLKLELTKEAEDRSWFTKATLSRFLCLVSAPELLKNVTSIENEISQLEDARNFHLALYAKDHAKASEYEPIEIGNCNGENLRPKGKELQVQSNASSDPTKNELIRAMDVRVIALKEEISASLVGALGSVPSADHLSDLRSFCDYFGASKIRDFLVKYLDPSPSGKKSSISGHKRGERSSSNNENLIIARESATLAKMAQAERQISSESEDSDSEKPSTERSRPLIRAPSPRRSASPMRRVQIGRSGTRKPAALSVRSLSYFPPREKGPQNHISTDEDPDQPSIRSEASARRMSVQDAISLFESKQRDQSSSSQSRRPSGEVSFGSNKPVLRRWSSGISESTREELQSVALPVEQSNEIVSEEVNPEASVIESNDVGLTKSVSSEVAQDKTSDASEWSRQKEAELNQMLMKFTETKKPSKYGIIAAPSTDKRADQSKKPNEKTTTTKRPIEKAITPVRAAQKAIARAEPLAQTQKPRRNSSPPVLSKKEAPKPAVSKKPSPTRSSLPASPLSRPVVTPRKPPSTTTIPRTERTPTSSKNGKSSISEEKKASPRTQPVSTIRPAKSKHLGRPSTESSPVTKPRPQNKAPKKSTVVPLESKSSKKVKPKESKSNATIEVVKDPLIDQEVAKLDHDPSPVKMESEEVNDIAATSEKMEETEQEEVKVISSEAWEEVDQDKVHGSDGEGDRQVDGPDAMPSSSSRMRHSLSQMLQAECNEDEVLEWGNAENPPALVYQKDTPKGLKRLLKFGRSKTKGEVNLSDRSSSSVLSDGEEESLAIKVNGKKGKNLNLDGKSVDLSEDSLSDRLGDRLSLREGQSSKGARSFFSLSTFRSRKNGGTSSR